MTLASAGGVIVYKRYLGIRCGSNDSRRDNDHLRRRIADLYWPLPDDVATVAVIVSAGARPEGAV